MGRGERQGTGATSTSPKFDLFFTSLVPLIRRNKHVYELVPGIENRLISFQYDQKCDNSKMMSSLYVHNV